MVFFSTLLLACATALMALRILTRATGSYIKIREPSLFGLMTIWLIALAYCGYLLFFFARSGNKLFTQAPFPLMWCVSYVTDSRNKQKRRATLFFGISAVLLAVVYGYLIWSFFFP